MGTEWPSTPINIKKKNHFFFIENQSYIEVLPWSVTYRMDTTIFNEYDMI